MCTFSKEVEESSRTARYQPSRGAADCEKHKSENILREISKESDEGEEGRGGETNDMKLCP